MDADVRGNARRAWVASPAPPHNPIQVSLSLTLTDELDSGPAPPQAFPPPYSAFPIPGLIPGYSTMPGCTLLFCTCPLILYLSAPPPRMSDSLSRLSSAPQAEFLKINALLSWPSWLLPVLGKDFLDVILPGILQVESVGPAPTVLTS